MDNTTQDGGPAFASSDQYGMSLRDWFAGQALAGIIACPGAEPDDASRDGCASLAYEFADAMIAERAKRA